MIGTLGQFVREIRDLLTGSGSPIPVDIGSNIDVTIDNTSLEISNDVGNPIPTVTGLSIPAHNYVLLDPPTQPTTVTYKSGGAGGTTVATLTLAYDGNGNLISVTKS